jgi:hypothetical protein
MRTIKLANVTALQSGYFKTIRRFRTFVFFTAFALLGLNLHVAGQMDESGATAKKWAAAFRSLERALQAASIR